MKVRKLRLDEELFDSDDIFSFDSFGDYDSHDIDAVLEGPAEGSDTGVAAEIIRLIQDEWEAIQGYNDAVATIRSVIADNPIYSKAIDVLEEISAEENRHVGQLQELLKTISPNAEDIEKGHEEAKDQLGFVNGKLQVQAWEAASPKIDNGANSCSGEDACTLLDIDDEM